MPIFLIFLNLGISAFLINLTFNNFNIDLFSTKEKIQKNTERFKVEQKMLKEKKSVLKSLLTLEKLVNNIPLFNLKDAEDEKYDYFEKRLHLTFKGVHITSKHFYLIKCGLIILYFLIILGMSFFDLKRFLLVVCYPIISMAFDLYFNMKIKSLDNKIKEDFYGFYSEFYYCYKFEQNQKIPIVNVAMRYYNRADKEMQVLIDNFKADCTSADEAKAIKNLKDNYRIVEVQRLATQLERLNKGLTLNGLENFKKELDDKEREKINIATQKRKEQIEIVTKIPFIVIFLIVIVFAVSAVE